MTIHDKDDVYNWSNSVLKHADGHAFTTFLATLNTDCTGTWCDWRIPTVLELQTILAQGYPCTASPCLSPTFGPTVAGPYWTDTQMSSVYDKTYFVDFSNGSVDAGDAYSMYSVRAVRGGL